LGRCEGKNSKEAVSYVLFIKPKAEEDITDATIYYESKNQGLGKRFLFEIDEKLNLVSTNPLLFQVRFKNVRFVLLKSFPFAIHYFIEDKKVFVIAVLSTSRNPRIWQSR
jgi:toxin ParE1/3/4